MALPFRALLAGLTGLLVSVFAPRPVSYLPEAFYNAFPLHPFELTVLLSGILGGICLALLAKQQRLNTLLLAVFGNFSILIITFTLNLCSPAEAERIIADINAMPSYNLAFPRDADDYLPIDNLSITYSCTLPGEHRSSLFGMLPATLYAVLGLAIGSLFVPRRRNRKVTLAAN
ncbi:hypothetical protein [Pseudomonas sp. Marseille-Q8238]